MISASIAETHGFGRVDKNGDDPAEVDAVVARSVDATQDDEIPMTRHQWSTGVPLRERIKIARLSG